MKSIRMFGLIFSLAALLAPAAHAQFAVFDASNFGEAVQEFGQLEQMYTTAVETRDQIVAAYNLAYQMSQMPQDMAMRYASQFSSWTDLASNWPMACPRKVKGFCSIVCPLAQCPVGLSEIACKESLTPPVICCMVLGKFCWK